MKLFSRLLAYLVVACVVTVVGLSSATQSVMAAQTTNPCKGLGIQSVSLTPVMPTAFSSLAHSQVGANCLAWQEFIDLNWQADAKKPGFADPNVPSSAFGEPDNVNPTVWESYLEATDVFRSAMLKSDLIGRNSIKSTAQTTWLRPRPPLKALSRLSKLGDTSIQLSSVTQADGGWLTAQTGDLVFYEVKLNQDEYEFITTNVFNGNDLTTFAGQAACASQPGMKGRGGFNLPAGNNAGNYDSDCQGNNVTYGQDIGSIEVKASWVVLPADGSLNYRYKISQAEINDPFGNKTNATVGLSGLHIIHKLPGAPQFIWATFEQIDNSPDDNNGHPGPPVLPHNTNQKQQNTVFSFFDTECTTSTDPVYKCIPNTQPGPPCPANGPEPAGCTPYSAPMQVTRMTPVQNDANKVTEYAWSLMPNNSVFNYYRLIDVQWPNAPSPVAPGTTTNNMPAGDITPNPITRFVANTTMETFVQNKQSCMSCHQVAPIAQAQQQSNALRGGVPTRKVKLSLNPKAVNSLPASDYSFIFAAETIK